MFKYCVPRLVHKPSGIVITYSLMCPCSRPYPRGLPLYTLQTVRSSIAQASMQTFPRHTLDKHTGLSASLDVCPRIPHLTRVPVIWQNRRLLLSETPASIQMKEWRTRGVRPRPSLRWTFQCSSQRLNLNHYPNDQYRYGSIRFCTAGSAKPPDYEYADFCVLSQEQGARQGQ